MRLCANGFDGGASWTRRTSTFAATGSAPRRTVPTIAPRPVPTGFVGAAPPLPASSAASAVSGASVAVPSAAGPSPTTGPLPPPRVNHQADAPARTSSRTPANARFMAVDSLFAS